MNSEKNDRSYEGPRGLKASFIESSHVIATGLGAEGIEESEIAPTAPIKLDFLPRDDLNVATNLKHCLCAQQSYNSPDWLSEISEFTQSGGGVQQWTEI